MFGGIAGEWHGEMAGGFEREQPGGRRRTMTADDGDGGRTRQTQACEGAAGFVH